MKVCSRTSMFGVGAENGVGRAIVDAVFLLMRVASVGVVKLRAKINRSSLVQNATMQQPLELRFTYGRSL